MQLFVGHACCKNYNSLLHMVMDMLDLLDSLRRRNPKRTDCNLEFPQTSTKAIRERNQYKVVSRRMKGLGSMSSDPCIFRIVSDIIISLAPRTCCFSTSIAKHVGYFFRSRVVSTKYNTSNYASPAFWACLRRSVRAPTRKAVRGTSAIQGIIDNWKGHMFPLLGHSGPTTGPSVALMGLLCFINCRLVPVTPTL